MESKNPRVIKVEFLETTLTDSQVELIEMASNDFTRKEIASELNLSVRTVEAYFDKLRFFLGKRTLTGLVAEAMRRGIIK